MALRHPRRSRGHVGPLRNLPPLLLLLLVLTMPQHNKSRDIRIEYPSSGATYSHDQYGVYEYDEYPSSSVLAGQTRRHFLDSFDTLEEAKAKFPNAEYVQGSGYTPPALDHLPDEFDL